MFTRADSITGNAWRVSLVAYNLGLTWGHGSDLTPDWTAGMLHREALTILNERADGDFATLSTEEQAILQTRLEAQIRVNHYASQALPSLSPKNMPV